MHFRKTPSLILLTLLALGYCHCTFGRNLHRGVTHALLDSFKSAIANAKTDTDRVNIIMLLEDNLPCNDSAQIFGYLNTALELSQRSHWYKGIFDVYDCYGDVYSECSELKNYDQAIRYYQLAFQVGEKAHDTALQTKALNGQAMTYNVMAQYKLALNCFEHELSLLREWGNIAATLGNIGEVYQSVGDYSQSLIYHDSSLKILEVHLRNDSKNNFGDSAMMGALLVTIGTVYSSMGQYDKALENCARAYNLNISDEVQQNLLRIWSLMEMASAYKSKKDTTNAIERYTEALAVCARVNDVSDAAGALNNLGSIYLDEGDIRKALVFADSALKLVDKHALITQQPAIYTTFGMIRTAQGQYADAVTYLQKAVDVSRASGARVAEKDAWEALSKTYHLMGRTGAELDAFRNFVALRDSVLSIEKVNALTRIDLQYQYNSEKEATAMQNKLKMQTQRAYTLVGFSTLSVVVLLAFFIYRGYNREKKANFAITAEKQISESLLLNILPGDVAKELKEKGNVQARQFEEVTVLFTDFANFTSAGERLAPGELVAELDACFKAFDGIIGRHNIEKIKTVGDAYMAVSGLPNANANHAAEVTRAAIEIRDFMLARKQSLGDKTFEMRIGINSGTVVAGIVGVKKFAYDIWGDTVNTAARMEQYCEPGKINISLTTYDMIKDKFVCQDRGEIDVKNKGRMNMYFVEAAV